MTIHHRRIPVLPNRSVTYPIARKILRSYPVGRQSFSRICKGMSMPLKIAAKDGFPPGIMANIITNMNSKDGTEWEKIPFKRQDEETLTCKIKPKYPGLHTFRAEFSLDKGKTWFRDAVSDAWILVDPPQVDGLLLYTLIPNISGNISDWKADLKRIKKMGFNTIHLLPITMQDTSQSPYSAKDLFHIDPGYLDNSSPLNDLEQLEDFIEEAKRLGIKLCFDLVLNHVGVNSFMATQAADWIVPDANQADGLCRAGYWCEKGWLYWDDLVLVNYEHPSHAIRAEIWSYMTEYTLFWSKFANETGGFVRFDNLHSSHPEFVQELTQTMHKKYPNLGIISEYFADESAMLNTVPAWGLNLNLAMPWDYKFVPQLRDYLNYIHRVSNHIRYFMPVTSHDSGTPAQEFGTAGSTIPRYVAAALLGTGATGMIQGVEYGEKQKINFIGEKTKKIFPAEAMFDPFITKVNELLLTYADFRHGGNCEFVDEGHHAVLAAFRESSDNQQLGFLVVCNFDIAGEQEITIDVSKLKNQVEKFEFCELLTGENETHTAPNFTVNMPPCSAKVYRIITS